MVDSLKPEFEGKIRFLIADLSSNEGRSFAQYQRVGSVTLLFFDPSGNRVTSLQGVQTEDYLRRAFQRTFRL